MYSGHTTGSRIFRVNHLLFFIDPVTGVHTQNIESYWNHCKVKIEEGEGSSLGYAGWVSQQVHVEGTRGTQLVPTYLTQFCRKSVGSTPSKPKF